MKKGFWWLLLALVTSTALAIDLEDYFADGEFQCTYQNPISVSIVNTEYEKDGTYMGRQYVEAAKLGEPKMRALVEFTGSWHITDGVLHQRIESYEISPLNEEGGELVSVMERIVKDLDPSGSVRVQVESRDSYLKVKNNSTIACVRV